MLAFIWSVNQTCLKLLQMYLIEKIRKKTLRMKQGMYLCGFTKLSIPIKTKFMILPISCFVMIFHEKIVACV
jgi:hypothetical protein